MLESLKHEVFEANILLSKSGLVTGTFGNVSGIDRESGIVAIKPSGVDYAVLKEEDIVLVDMEGNKIEGKYNPSVDLPTHLELYKAFPEIGGVTHTHSMYASAFAQSGRAIRPYGTTHADYFGCEIPVTRPMTPEEIGSKYEKNTGLVIAELFREYDSENVRAVLVRSHGPFTWGKNADASVHNSMYLEMVANLAFVTEQLNPSVKDMDNVLLRKHYDRKNGKNSYYGQGK